jgi:ABC-2 type transport system ATP-binding protein
MLQLSDLRKRYGTTEALAGCTFTGRDGRILGLLGPNGSGKTTAIRAIFGMVRLDGGNVRWNGMRLGPDERQRLGYMPEERGLYPRMRVREQVSFFAQLHGLNAEQADSATAVWLGRLGLSSRGADRVEELSHGNQQRVQLAAALVHDPDAIVLDEPFAGLDPVGVADLGALLREEAAAGAAVIFSSHQLDLVQDLCDDVAIVSHGQVVLDGDMLQVRLASPHRYVEISLGDTDDRDDDWYAALEGIEIVDRRERSVRLRLRRNADPGPLLAAAERAGEVEYFRFEPPQLSDLFLEAVGR